MNEQANTERMCGQMGIHSTRAFNKLVHGKPGDVVHPAEMTAIVGRDCGKNGRGRQNVRTAILACERHGVIWRWMRPLQAWECQDDVGSIAWSGGQIPSATRKLSRAMRVLATVSPENLDEEARCDYSLNVAICGTMRLLGHGGTRKKLEERIETLAEPDIGSVLKLMQQPPPTVES